MSSAASSPSLTQRFALLIEGLKRAIADGSGRDKRLLGPLTVLLWNYLGRKLRRFEALAARVAAGDLVAARRRAVSTRRSARKPVSRIPYGPVLVRFGVAHLYAALQALIDDPEMRALLAAEPRVGGLLRSLWRMASPDPLPDALRLASSPRRPYRPRPPKREPPIRQDAAELPVPPDGRLYTWTPLKTPRISSEPPTLAPLRQPRFISGS
jgi:hypothetical protein